MAKEKEKTELKKGISKFELVGKLKLNDFSFTLDKKSKNSDWIYNQAKLIVNAGNGNEVSCELMGGYGEKRKNVLYVCGKKLSDKSTPEKEIYVDDFENQYTIAWEDRHDETIIAEIGSSKFKRVGIEVDTEGKIVTQKFLSPYDMIKYISENKDKIDGKVVRINGTVKYKVYNGNFQKVKEIDSIFISKAEEKDFKAEFTQTILIEKDSFGKKDKETGLFDVSAYVVENLKDYDGKDITVKNKKGKPVGRNIPLPFMMYAENEKLEKLFKVKRDTVTELTVIGNIIEGKAKSTVSYDDLDDDMKELIDMGAYDLETLAQTISTKGERVSQWVIQKPVVKMVGEGEDKTPQISRTEEKYTSDDLIMDFLNIEDDEFPFGENEEEEDKKEEETDLDDLLNNL